jgi:hypothetical protein
MKVLANDGLDQSGIDALTEKGFEVITTKVPQEFLVDYINEHKIRTLLVRSATQVRKDIIDNCPSIDIIGRGGVGMDNIDVDYAREKGIHDQHSFSIIRIGCRTCFCPFVFRSQIPSGLQQKNAISRRYRVCRT